MSSPSTIHGIPTPAGGDDNDSVAAISAVITALEGGSIIRRLTQAQINALTGAQKPSGLFVWNTTTNRLQVSNGTTVSDYNGALYCEGIRSSAQTFTDATSATLTYDSESDPYAFLNSGTGLVTIPTTGVWALSLRASWGADFTGFTEASFRNVSGGTTLVSQRYTSDGWQARNIALTSLVRLASGTTVDARLYQDSSGSQTATGTFTAVMIGTA